LFTRAAAAQDAPPTRAPVILDGRTLFEVARLENAGAEERAEAIGQKIQVLAADITVPVSTIRFAQESGVSGIVSPKGLVVILLAPDAELTGRPIEEVGREWETKIREGVSAYRDARLWRNILHGSLRALLVTLVALVLFLGLLRTTRFIERRVEARLTDAQDGFTSLVRERAHVFLRKGVRLTRVAGAVVLFYLYLPFALKQFPGTHGWSEKLFEWIWAPLRWVGSGVFAYIPDFFTVAIVALVTYYAIKAIRFLFERISDGRLTLENFDPDWANPTYKIVRVLVLAFAAVVVYPYLPGSDSDAFKGVGVFLGLLLSLGSTSAVSNVVAGTILTYTGALRTGDRIRIAEAEGDVVETTLLVTRLRTPKNVIVTIPNSIVLNSQVVNYSAMTRKGESLILHTTITIGYDVPWRLVHEALLAAARATGGVVSDPAPFVLQTALNDYHISYQLNAFTNVPAEMVQTYSTLHENIQDRFAAAGIEILSPAYNALRDGNKSTIPQPSR
jgi:small-conductance mechanosensitive channel